MRGRVPPDLVEHHIGRCIAFEVDHHPHAFTRGFVADIDNPFDPLVLGRLGDFLDKVVLADLKRDRGEYDALPVIAPGFNLVATAHQDRPAPGGIGRACAVGA